MQKKFISLLTSVCMLCSLCTVSVSAEEQILSYDSTVDTSGTTYVDVGVDAERAEMYTVTLPKRVTLDVTEDDIASFTYDVTVLGEISSSHYVRVIPLDGVTLTNGTQAINLNVIQEKRRFTSDECLATTTTQGTMQVDNLEPGVWEGSARYKVALDDGGYWTPATCTAPATCIGYDSNDNGVLDLSEDVDGDGNLDVAEIDTNGDGVVDVDEDIDGDGKFDIAEDSNENGVLDLGEKLPTPVTVGTALGHEFPDGDVAFPSTCERCSKPIYAITNETQFNTFATNVNNGNAYIGANVELFTNIDLSGDLFTPIGTINNPFSGSFDGHGYTIKGIDITVTGDEQSAGLFGVVKGSNVTFKNLVIDNPKVSVTACTIRNGKLSTGALVGKYTTSSNTAITIDNIHVKDLNYVVDGGAYRYNGADTYNAYGGIVGVFDAANATLNMSNCFASGDIAFNFVQTHSTPEGIGGMVGLFTKPTTTINGKNCMSVVNAVKVGTIQLAATGWIFDTYSNNTGKYFGVAQFMNSVTDANKTMRTGMTTLTTEECQAQAALDILNTNNTKIWVLDLENANSGYPVVSNVA